MAVMMRMKTVQHSPCVRQEPCFTAWSPLCVLCSNASLGIGFPCCLERICMVQGRASPSGLCVVSLHIATLLLSETG